MDPILFEFLFDFKTFLNVLKIFSSFLSFDETMRGYFQSLSMTPDKKR